MRVQSFYHWLAWEVTASRTALVGLYEYRDRLLYIEAPPLRSRYMQRIGAFEEGVLEAELELRLLHRKLELIQAAINRREPIRMEAIDAALQREKEAIIAQAEDGDLTLGELPQLSPEEQANLQRLYRQIISAFHPAMDPDMTQTHKELYEKALQAYRMQDAQALQLIHDLLFSPPDQCLSLELANAAGDARDTRRDDYRSMAGALAIDYRLAQRLYPCFVTLEEDAVVLDTLKTYAAQRQALQREIEAIRAAFPFNAQSTLDDPAKTEDYLAQLRVRLMQCEQEKAALERRITQLTEGNLIG